MAEERRGSGARVMIEYMLVAMEWLASVEGGW